LGKAKAGAGSIIATCAPVQVAEHFSCHKGQSNQTADLLRIASVGHFLMETRMSSNDMHPTRALAKSQLLREKMSYTEFFKSRTDLVKAQCETVKSYIQISSAALALPILFTKAWFGEPAAKAGFHAMGVPWSLRAAWVSFLLAIGFGLAYQWLIVRRLWDKLHRDHLTSDNAEEWAVAQAAIIPKLEWLDRSYLYGGMVICFYVGACFFVFFTWVLMSAN
jgi:hypothetical protein